MASIRIALYHPDIPQNVGAILRLAACLDLPVEVIEPCGFPWDDRKVHRVAMDYGPRVAVGRHASWAAFLADRPAGRLVLLSTRGAVAHHAFTFRPGDTLLAGRESAGVPEAVHAAAEAVVAVPTAVGTRSLNVAVACALVAGEALRQLDAWPPRHP